MSFKDVSFGNLEAFNVVVEISQGSNLKFELDEQSDSLKLNFTFKDLAFPFNYGFIAGTLGGDGDALDAIVLSSAVIKSGTVAQCRAIGILKTLDRGEVDNKIVCVPVIDQQYFDINDLPPDSLEKWTEFYLEVARQKQKIVKILGLKNKQEAAIEIKNSLV